MTNKLSDIEMSVNSLTDVIIISWTEYKQITPFQYKLIKKRSSSPRTITDGTLIYTGNNLSYSDTDIKDGEIYYYRLFIILDEEMLDIITDNRCVVSTIAFKNLSKFGNSLYKSLPEQVRYQDTVIKKDLPLERYLKLMAFPFNKIETFTEAMLQQIDIDECDERFLPYHAKWIGYKYNDHFTSDINRLILKTLNEAEPYMGTKIGLEYILQRIFKAEVSVSIDTAVNINVINMKIDSSNSWLLNHIESINGLIRITLPLRTNFEVVTNLQDNEVYDKTRENDQWTHIAISEVVLENRIKPMSDTLLDIIHFIPEDEEQNVIALTNDSRFTTNENLYTVGLVSGMYYRDDLVE